MMQTRSRWRTFFTAVTLYAVSGGAIAYFAYHAYSGDHGLTAKQAYEDEAARLETELASLRAQRRAIEHKVSLLAPNGIDPDMLDEEGRRQLDFVHVKDLVLLKQRR